LGDKIPCIPEDEKQIELYHNSDVSTKMHILICHSYITQFCTGCAKCEEDAHSGCEGPTVAISGAGGSSPEECDGTSRITIAFAWIMRVSEAWSIVPLSPCEQASVLPSAVSSSGAKASHGEVPGEILAQLNSGKEDGWLTGTDL
jgi:hypothetical protein